MVLHSGRVLTVDSADSIQQAIAVSGNTVQAVGCDEDVLALAGPETRFIDLHSRTVIPGIIDTHAHMDREGGNYAKAKDRGLLRTHCHHR